MRVLFAIVASAFLAIEPALGESKVLLPRLKPKGLVAWSKVIRKGATPAATPQAPAAAALKISFPDVTKGYDRERVLAARRACMEKLKGLDLELEPLPPLGQEGGCGTAAPLLLSKVAGVTITPPAEANCDFAEALHHWVAWSVKPAASKHLKKALVTINNASAYVCRRRNNQAAGKLSEHAFANALDISTLVFKDGSAINIKGDWSGLRQVISASAKGAFLRTIRQYACIRFTTVLGPGSDPYHGDHFHVDLAKRRSGFRICN